MGMTKHLCKCRRREPGRVVASPPPVPSRPTVEGIRLSRRHGRLRTPSATHGRPGRSRGDSSTGGSWLHPDALEKSFSKYRSNSLFL